MKNTRVARRYATALMSAAEQQKTIDGTARDLEVVGKVLGESRELRQLIGSPIVSPAKKRIILDEVFASHVSRETMRFIGLLTSKSRESVLGDIVEQFRELHDEKFGVVNIEVRVAVELNYAQEKDLRGQLERITEKKVRLRFVIDKTMRGGLIIRIGDTVLDASITRQLERMREQFIAGRAA